MSSNPNISLNNNRKDNYKIPKIGVSGTADMGFLDEDVYLVAKTVGAEIAKQGAIMMSGATTGFPYWAAVGCKEASGMSIGFSPASNPKEHAHIYHLPLDNMDFIIYTGFGYNGRDLLFTRSCDAVIIGPGRIGTLHEFAVAYEDQKPMGILESDQWETDELLRQFMIKSHRPNKHIIFDKDPKVLVAKLLEMIKAEDGLTKSYNNHDYASDDAKKVVL